MNKKGLVQVYTGNGKGKTTAAIGLAIRARSHGLAVCYVYFHKDPKKWGYTEHRLLKKVGISVFGFARHHPFCDKKVKKEYIRKECLKGVEFIKKIYDRKKVDLLILDEINISLRDKFLTIKEVMLLLKHKPENLELVLTGRGAPTQLIKAADLVSRIQLVKHPYQRGVKQREGIEY